VKGLEKKLDALIDTKRQQARKTELTNMFTDNVRALVKESSALNLITKMDENRANIENTTPRISYVNTNTKASPDNVANTNETVLSNGNIAAINQDPKNIFINVQPLHAWEYDGTPDPDILLE
jgi:hypothetical protein